MQMRSFAPDDIGTVAAAVALTNAAAEVDAPFEHATTPDELSLMLRHGWDGEAPETWAAWEGDRLVGLLSLNLSEWDNTHLAWLDLLVHPDARGAGRGAELLAFGESRASELGRTSIGTSGWDSAGTSRFAAKHELVCKSVAVKRRQQVDRLDRGVLEAQHLEASGHAGEYELLRHFGPTPDDLMPSVAELTAAINDAPMDDLDIEDEVFPVERIAGYETAQLARNRRLYRVLARHRVTGELAGHTVVVVEAERPEIAEQHDTSVVAAHRGHRLGTLLKTDMLRWLADEEPAVETLDTWNMESNAPMIGVNELLGYQVLGRELEFQRDVRR